MEACRICSCYLSESSMLSILDFNSHGLSYSNMITILLNAKVVIDDKSATKICFSCEQKLTQCYEFKSLVQRSEMYHQGKLNKKILSFNNIDNIIDMVEFKTESKADIDLKPTFTWKFFEDGSNEIPYNNVTIKRIEPYSVAAEVDNFENYEPELNYEDDNETQLEPELEMSLLDRKKKTKKKKNDDSDEDYHIGMRLLPNKKKAIPKKKYYKYTKKIRDSDAEGIHVNIKPTVLNGYKLVPPTVIVRKKRREVKVIEKAEICPHCGLLKKNLESHLMVHSGEKKFKCEICDKEFYTPARLKAHKIKHSSVQYRCDNCVAVFKCRGSLTSHMKVHMDVRAHVCEICSKGFKRKAALTRHLLTHSIANKKFQCNLCNMSFFYRGGLKHHIRIHTGDRPFKCEICSQPYSYKHDFNRHCLNKHGVFLKRRDVRVMNEEVLTKEKKLTQDLIYKINNINHNNEPINPFSGPQAALAFELAVKQLIKQNAVITSC